jgi:hypothetical protein
MFAKQVLQRCKMARNGRSGRNTAQGWITASQEPDAVRISASDGFDLTSCVAPKPQPAPHAPRPHTAAPAVELKNPYRGLIKDGKVSWVRAPAFSFALSRGSLTRARWPTSPLFPQKTRVRRPKFSCGCTARAA